METNHIGNGYEIECVHSGQKRPYGDTHYEFSVKTDKDFSEVEKYCTENVYQCSLTTKEYLAGERAGVKDFGDHFRTNYELKKVRDGEYLYRVTRPSTH